MRTDTIADSPSPGPARRAPVVATVARTYAAGAVTVRTATDSALDRWAALVRARREQMEAQLAALGGAPDDWWSARAGSFARGIGVPAAPPPFGVQAIADRLGREDTLIDIGAGAGRYAVPLSRVLRQVTLVEPSAAMAEGAAAAFAAAGRENYVLVRRQWPRARVPAASAVLIANVLSPVEDLSAFLKPARARAREWLFIVHGAVRDGGEATARVIDAFHGQPRVPNPDLGDLIPALHELGIYPDVLMGSRQFQRTFADLDQAERATAASALVEPTPETLHRIRAIVRPRLRRSADGRLVQPPQEAPVGLLIWRVGAAGAGG